MVIATVDAPWGVNHLVGVFVDLTHAVSYCRSAYPTDTPEQVVHLWDDEPIPTVGVVGGSVYRMSNVITHAGHDLEFRFLRTEDQ